MANLLLVLVLAALTGTALSHGMVTTYQTSSGTHQGFILDYYYDRINNLPVPDTASWYTENLDSGFVSPADYGTSDINCHKAATPGTLTTTVPAGSSVKFNWTPTPWPHPYGPILTYVAKCGGSSCVGVDKTTLKWVKIQADGSTFPPSPFPAYIIPSPLHNIIKHERTIVLTSVRCHPVDFATQKWASADLIANNGAWTTTIPASLAPGNYVLRHEIIALHGAGALNGAQNYPQCINIEITGSGTASPTGTLGTALYKNTDPGIYLNPYVTLTSYAMPGPALFTG